MPPLPDTASIPQELPVGVVLPYAGLLAATDASSTALAEIKAVLAGQGWLYCDGGSYSCNDYARLYGVIGNSFGGDTTNFNVPDLRGRFMRGVDGGAGQDPDALGRTATAQGGATGDHVGSLQADAFQGHEHQYTSTMESPTTAESKGPPLLNQLADQATTSVVSDGTNGTPRTTSETRPVNLAMNYLIRYR
jgi:microcystin-dependent protein